MTIAAVAVFLYAWLVPLGVWGFMTWRQSASRQMSAYSFLETVCVYGYSLFIYIPTSVSLTFRASTTALGNFACMCGGLRKPFPFFFKILTFVKYIDLKLQAFLKWNVLPFLFQFLWKTPYLPLHLSPNLLTKKLRRITWCKGFCDRRNERKIKNLAIFGGSSNFLKNYRRFSADLGQDVSRDVIITTRIRTKPASIHEYS